MSESYSAYQDLMTALVTRRPDQSAAEDERIVLAALAKHAHELAERQRTWALDYDGPQESSYDYTYAVTLGAKLAADLIDPLAGPVRPDEEPT